MTELNLTFDPSCMDDYDPNSLPVEAALDIIHQTVAPVLGQERVAIRDSLGRILGEDVRSPMDVPGHDNSAMDGYAVSSACLEPESGQSVMLKVTGTSWAGHPYPHPIASDEAVRIMTGGVMPQGADTVVIQERATQVDEHVSFSGDAAVPSDNVRFCGEDFKAGEIIIPSGTRIGPAELGLMASVGIVEITIKRRLRVAFFSTGDELRSLGETLETGNIYDSNRYTLYGMLHNIGADLIDMGVVRDDRDAVEQAFERAASVGDVVITSGGVSVGEADFVKETLERMGSVSFWKIAMKPGRPLAFGTVRGALFFGLPGNPVSVMVTFVQFVEQALRKMMGEAPRLPNRMLAQLTTTAKKRPGRVEFQRGILRRDQAGNLAVASTGAQGSGILSSMRRANCFIILPLENAGAEPGDMVEVEPFGPTLL